MARAVKILVIGLSLLTGATSTRSETNHDLIHREFVELVRVMNKGQAFDCQRVGRDRSGCFFFSATAQRQLFGSSQATLP